MPDLHPIVESLDQQICKAIPELQYAVKWKRPFYGLPDLGWIIETAAYDVSVNVVLPWLDRIERRVSLPWLATASCSRRESTLGGWRYGRGMFEQVTIRAADARASERFYRTTLGALGIEPTGDGPGRIEWDDFAVASADAAKPPTRNLLMRRPSRKAAETAARRRRRQNSLRSTREESPGPK